MLMKNISIKTTRLLLRPFALSDLDDLQEIFGDAQVMEYVEPPYTRERTEAFLRDFCVDQGKTFAVARKTDGKLVGYLLFKPYGEPEVYELGWIFNRSCWRQGYAYEACSALRDYAFRTAGAHKLFAETIDPVKSAGLMRKLGMRPEGVQRQQVRNSLGAWADLYFYGLLRDDLK